MRLALWSTLVFLVAVGTSALAQPPGNTAIRVRSSFITGTTVVVVGDTLLLTADGPVKFPIEYVNRDNTSYDISNGFVIYSPDGAAWTHWIANGGNYDFAPTPVQSVWIDTTGFYPHSDFGGHFSFKCLGCDGIGADTVVFDASANDPSQLAAHPVDSGIVFLIILRLRFADTCKSICFDSVTSVAAQDRWKWTSFNQTPEYTTLPAWSGPRCFKIKVQKNCRYCKPSACCVGNTGNVDCDPNGRVDISDLTRLIDYAFISRDPLCCPQAANLDGDDWGGVDISDVSRMISYLFIDFWLPAPCPTLNTGCWSTQ
ncbi:MAG: hypothetical protein HY851_10320 [candidate division Zixibacteria bacterium]|nr:hypothetical protein [candidate division Zixibacteria bacterium]